MRAQDKLARRRVVEEFLRRSGEEIEITRVIEVSDGQGGFVRQDPPESVGMMKFHVADPTAANPPRSAIDPPVGLLDQFDLVLVGRWDYDVLRGDEFQYGDFRFRVDHVSLSRQDRVVIGARYV